MNFFCRPAIRSALCGLTLAANALVAPGASAAVIDFDSVTTRFWISDYSELDFEMARANDGMGTLAAGYNETYWRGNGTGRLLTWVQPGL
jgi:hypothetical protein